MIPKACWKKTSKVPLLAAGVFAATLHGSSVWGTLDTVVHSRKERRPSVPVSACNVQSRPAPGRRVIINKLIIKMSFFYF